MIYAMISRDAGRRNASLEPGFINAFIRPLLVMLTLPLTVLSISRASRPG